MFQLIEITASAQATIASFATLPDCLHALARAAYVADGMASFLCTLTVGA